MNKFKTMTYKEFCEYCNDRACDSKWSMDEAILCIEIANKINAIVIKPFGIISKKRTEKAREIAWQETIKEFVS